MDTWSVGEVASALAVTPATVLRATARLDLAHERTQGGHRRYTTATVVDQLIPALGVVPVVDGLTREAVQILAGLSRHPLGLRSLRAIARAARVSTTTAARLLPDLVSTGCVISETRRVAAGRAVDETLHCIDWSSPRWQALAPTIARVVLPRERPRPVGRNAVPVRLGHLLWNAELAQLDCARDATYLAGRLLLSGDTQGLAWATTNLPPAALLDAALLRHASSRQRSLATNIAAARLQFLDATSQRPVEALGEVAGLRVAGLGDLLATKLEVLADRGELRDYFDIWQIEVVGGRRIEEGIGIFLARYGADEGAVVPIVLALGSFDDVADDPMLPVGRPQIEAWFRARQPEVAAHLATDGSSIAEDAANRAGIDRAIQRPAAAKGACGAWMPRAKARCGRPTGHRPPHRQRPDREGGR